ncbi:MAG: hypothetical protein IPK19_30010 [Chloroflexi bacterium]|nr:hypothetical protein [Chloroflexota bacterium]
MAQHTETTLPPRQRRARRLLVAMTLVAVSVLATGALFRAVYDRFPNYQAIAAFPELKPEVRRGDLPLPLPSLRSLVEGRTGEATADAIAEYYAAERDSLALIFNETDDQRLRGLLAMYMVHLAVPYAPIEEFPADLVDYVRAPAADCGVYTAYTLQVGQALGLTGRSVLIDMGNHATSEFLIGERWEIFDATFNMWVDQSVESLYTGAQRLYRTFYSPITDPLARPTLSPDEIDWYRLRGELLQWGLSIYPVPISISGP